MTLRTKTSLMAIGALVAGLSAAACERGAQPDEGQFGQPGTPQGAQEDEGLGAGEAEQQEMDPVRGEEHEEGAEGMGGTHGQEGTGGMTGGEEGTGGGTMGGAEDPGAPW